MKSNHENLMQHELLMEALAWNIFQTVKCKNVRRTRATNAAQMISATSKMEEIFPHTHGTGSKLAFSIMGTPVIAAVVTPG